MSVGEKHKLSDYAYNKYVKKYHDAEAEKQRAEAKAKSDKRKDWWGRYWIALAGLILAAIGIALTVLLR